MNEQDELTTQEQELAEYLEERIEPGLKRSKIPDLSRSIAKEIVDREYADEDLDVDEADEEADVEEHVDDEPDGEPIAEEDDELDDEDDVDDEPDDEPEDEPEDEFEEEPDDDDEEEDEEPDGESESPLDAFEAEMHELQAELGDDWILRFSVQGDDSWLTAEKADGSQHVEGPTAEVILEAVELLDKSDD